MNFKRVFHKRPDTLALLKRFLFYSLPLLWLLGSAFFIYYNLHSHTERKILSSSETNKVNLQGKAIVSDFPAVVSDLLFLSKGHEVQKLFGPNHSDALKDLGNDLLSFCANKLYCNQLRILDSAGMEIVNISTKGATRYIVPEEELQFKARRYYFQNIIKLGRGETYISPFDLNIERGRIERPLKPVIRFGTPFFDSRGQKQGVIILNYAGKHLLEFFENTLGL
ncbi:MAG: PAS domain-containing sensor histidine kinase, partial [Deltaproteobacteria bacterium]|nr:PAS domain-containing sensor histidine kinase [Deltaproteobacteria bacterium]